MRTCNEIVSRGTKESRYFVTFISKVVIGAVLVYIYLGIFSLYAQVGIGTNNPDPSAALEVAATDKGFLLPRMSQGQMEGIASPAEGLMVYCTDCDPKGAYVYDGDGFYLIDWDYPVTVDSFDCSNAIVDGLLLTNIATSGIVVELPYTGSNGGRYDAVSVSSSGVGGLVISAPRGELPTGDGNLFFSIEGTPDSDGTASFALELGGQSCTLEVTVLSALVASLDCSGAVVNGTLVGKSEAVSVPVSLPYTGGNGGAYAISVASTGVTGLTLEASGMLANGDGNLEFGISGTPNTGGTASFNVVVGDKNCTLEVPVEFPNAEVTSLDCSSAVAGADLKEGEVAAFSVSIPYTAGNGGLYDAISIPSTGVSGLTATAASGAVALDGDGTLNLQISGTPTSGGTASFSLSFGNQTCTLQLDVLPIGSVANFTDFTFTGDYVGLVEMTDGVLTVDYVGGNGGFYDGFTVNSTVPTGESGGLTASIEAGVLNVGAGTLTFSVTGTPFTATEIKFPITALGDDISATLVVTKLIFNGLEYNTVQGAAGKSWLDRNLGATRVATSFNDQQSYGYYYQWGRDNDGHQDPNSNVITGPISPPSSPNPNFVIGGSIDWVNSNASDQLNRWRYFAKGDYDPCPTNAFRLAINNEWTDEILAWTADTNLEDMDRTDAFASPLKLPAAGARSQVDGSGVIRGEYGYYWTGNKNDGSAGENDYGTTIRFMQNRIYYNSHPKAGGFPVRCIRRNIYDPPSP